MTLQEEIELAREVCVSAHRGQFRRDMVTPYHTHPFAVADAVPDALKPAALLHDVVEDTPMFIDELHKMGFSNRTVQAVWMLTHYKDNSYDSYIQILMQCDDAVLIKIADMEHNLSCEPSERSKEKCGRWLPVLKARAAEINKSAAGAGDVSIEAVKTEGNKGSEGRETGGLAAWLPFPNSPGEWVLRSSSGHETRWLVAAGECTPDHWADYTHAQWRKQTNEKGQP